MKCQKCNQEFDALHKICMYCDHNMSHLGVFTPINLSGFEFFTINICNGCRSSWMEAIKNWFNTPVLSDVVEGSGIFVRINGEMKEISEKKWEQMYPGSTPYRVKIMKEKDE